MKFAHIAAMSRPGFEAQWSDTKTETPKNVSGDNHRCFPDFLPIYYLICREHLKTRYFNYEEGRKTVFEIVNFIHKNFKNHREFRNFIDNLSLEDKSNYISFYCIVRLLNCWSRLLCFLMNKIKLILNWKRMSGCKISCFLLI